LFIVYIILYYITGALVMTPVALWRIAYCLFCYCYCSTEYEKLIPFSVMCIECFVVNTVVVPVETPPVSSPLLPATPIVTPVQSVQKEIGN